MFRPKESISGMMARAYRESREEEVEPYRPDLKINDIDWGFVRINYKQLALKEKILCEEKIKMVLPESYEKKDAEWIEGQYGAYSEIIEAYADEREETVFLFRMLDGFNTAVETITDIRDVFVTIFKVAEHVDEIEDVELLEWDGERTATLSYVKDEGIGEFRYFYFMKYVEDKLLFGTFSCMEEFWFHWCTVIKQLCLTIKNCDCEDK